MPRALINLIVELSILFSIIYIMFTCFTTDNEIVEIISYCTIVIIALVEWRMRELSRSQSVTDK